MDDILTLQDFTHLVPKKDLCEKLPLNKFSRTLFVWDNEGKLMSRILAQTEYTPGAYACLTPAPTLQELIIALEDLHIGLTSVTLSHIPADPGTLPALYTISWKIKRFKGCNIIEAINNYSAEALSEALVGAYLEASEM